MYYRDCIMPYTIFYTHLHQRLPPLPSCPISTSALSTRLSATGPRAPPTHSSSTCLVSVCSLVAVYATCVRTLQRSLFRLRFSLQELLRAHRRITVMALAASSRELRGTSSRRTSTGRGWRRRNARLLLPRWRVRGLPAGCCNALT
jgi:hypothetical protein